MSQTLAVIQGAGELVHPGSHQTTHGLADALERMVELLRAKPDRMVRDGELFDAASPAYPWIDVQSARIAA